MLYKNDNENFAVLYKNGIKIYSLNIKKKTFDEVNNLNIKNEINIKTNNNKIIYNNVMECLPKKKLLLVIYIQFQFGIMIIKIIIII